MAVCGMFPGVGIRRKTFATYSWQELSQISKAGLARSRFAIGDTREVTVGTGDTAATYHVAILDFDHDSVVPVGSAGMTLGFVEALDTKYRMHSASSNAVSWEGAELRGVLQTEIWDTLPADLRAVIRPVYKWTVQSAAEPAKLVRTEDALWLPAEDEVFTYQAGYAGQGEGTPYPYFDDDRMQVKYLRSGTAVGWWERSPSVLLTQYADRTYCYSTKVGLASWYMADRKTHYVSPCFCI